MTITDKKGHRFY